ncbi:DUF916 domain-containing protein [Lacticaseibacillus chiayiensis]|uniref:DUF916 and DUF3324 domain-containing protein n=1 Tax=Lacticaseibacillus chiayiensis TaxID=2100821 RepID=A0ABY6H9M7_9LACO|nr:DUF916 domain-containing protein [Lacticaseibacillus chiayiensis]UYN57237.1 DUF916 and DUF3324 domain-containing protein [Lacticaseibacillus chiayiensis]
MNTNLKRRLCYRQFSFIVMFLTFLLFGGYQAKSTFAAVNNPQQTLMVAPVIPADNQVNKAAGYFELQLPQNETRTLTVQAYNASSKALTVQVTILDAQTATNGVVQYVKPKQVNRQYLTIAGSDLVKTPTQITLAPSETKDVPIILKASKSRPKGTYLSAISLMALTPTGTANVHQRIAYTIGLVLHQGHESPSISQLRLKQTALIKRSSGFQLRYQLVNPRRFFLKDTVASVELTNASSRFFSLKMRQPLSRIAPQSQFVMTHDIQGQKPVAGQYRLVAEIKQGRHLKTITQYVRITRDGKLIASSRTAFRLAQQKWNLLKVAIAMVMLGITSFVIFRWRQHQKAKKSAEI